MNFFPCHFLQFVQLGPQRRSTHSTEEKKHLNIS